MNYLFQFMFINLFKKYFKICEMLKRQINCKEIGQFKMRF